MPSSLPKKKKEMIKERGGGQNAPTTANKQRKSESLPTFSYEVTLPCGRKKNPQLHRERRLFLQHWTATKDGSCNVKNWRFPKKSAGRKKNPDRRRKKRGSPPFFPETETHRFRQEGKGEAFLGEEVGEKLHGRRLRLPRSRSPKKKKV